MIIRYEAVLVIKAWPCPRSDSICTNFLFGFSNYLRLWVLWLFACMSTEVDQSFLLRSPFWSRAFLTTCRGSVWSLWLSTGAPQVSYPQCAWASLVTSCDSIVFIVSHQCEFFNDRFVLSFGCHSSMYGHLQTQFWNLVTCRTAFCRTPKSASELPVSLLASQCPPVDNIALCFEFCRTSDILILSP